jgi:two-component system chemotaxis sensor kinase CheA
MTECALHTLPAALQSEFDSIRDQRDLYRSLLLSEPEPLAIFMGLALETVESIRSALRMPTRDAGAFRGKIERLQMELMGLEQALTALPLPTVSWRLQSASSAINEIALRADITGNALLPVMVVLEELCSHLLIAADTAAVHLTIDEGDEPDEEIEASERRTQPRLAAALKQMSERLATEYGKNVSLVTMGLEDIPEAWSSALFDLLGQMLRNAIEHGIEAPAHRVSLGKSEVGTMVVEFVDRGAAGFELNAQDDGAGLDGDRIAEVAIRLGLLNADAPRPLDPSRIVSLIFHPGVTTSRDPARRGLGMQIVREHVQRLDGKLQIATKRGQYVRFQITLPAVTPTA